MEQQKATELQQEALEDSQDAVSEHISLIMNQSWNSNQGAISMTPRKKLFQSIRTFTNSLTTLDTRNGPPTMIPRNTSPRSKRQEAISQGTGMEHK